MNITQTLKPCPFCGSDVDSYKDSEDFIHSTPSIGSRLYEINCLSIYGGCGASILGDSPEDCIAKWQSRYVVYTGFNFDDYMSQDSND